MAPKKPVAKTQVARSITRGRPPLSKPQNASLSAKATRTLIRSHHNLRKAHASAVAASDHASVAEIEAQINANGGLESYQLASTLGQSSERGGDSSKVMVEWRKAAFREAHKLGQRLRMLEIGALSTRNACSKVSCLEIERIDLNSQEPDIRQVDFMDLQVPVSEEDKFHILSLSLVLNFVPDAVGRGEMLKRIPDFMHQNAAASPEHLRSTLFLVLPLPCVSNSRYLTEDRLEEIMKSLGMALDQVKKTTKLYYSLWTCAVPMEPEKSQRNLLKEEIRSGKGRNNFAIVLK